MAAIAASLVAAAPAAAATDTARGKGTVTINVAVKKFAVSSAQRRTCRILTLTLDDLRLTCRVFGWT